MFLRTNLNRLFGTRIVFASVPFRTHFGEVRTLRNRRGCHFRKGSVCQADSRRRDNSADNADVSKREQCIVQRRLKVVTDL